MTNWHVPLAAHLDQLQPLLRRRTPVKFDGSPKASQLKTEIQAWNRQVKHLLSAAPQGKKRLVAFQQLGNMTFTSLDAVREQLKRRQRFLHDVLLSVTAPTSKKAGVINRSQLREFRYAFCLTFAGEDRAFAAAVNTALRKKRHKTFFDKNKDARTRLLGEPGPDVLHAVFSEESELCLMFTSKAYKERMWTSVERVGAQARSTEQGGSYIIPIRLDATPIPGLAHTIGHLSKQDGVVRIVNEVIAKLKAVRAERVTAGKIGKRQTTQRMAIQSASQRQPKRTPAPPQPKPSHAVLIGERVFTAKHVKRAGSITVLVFVKTQEELTALRKYDVHPRSWKEIPFADASGGESVTVENFEASTDHAGSITVLLELRPSRQQSVTSFGLPPSEAENVVRQILTGAPHPSGWFSLPHELKGGVVALAARTSARPQDVALYARLLAIYHLQKLCLLSSIQELKVTKVGHQYRVQFQGELNQGPFGVMNKVSVRLDQRVAGAFVQGVNDGQ